MRKLAILCGLPLSGKSTLSTQLQRNDQYTRVCPDDVRLSLHGQQFIASAEPLVWAIVEVMARALYKSNNNVLIDATNTTKERRKQWVRLAKEIGVELKIYRVKTSYEECIRRNKELKRLDPSIIERMNLQFEEPTEEEGEVVEI